MNAIRARSIGVNEATLLVETKSSYGKTFYWPQNDLARGFARLLRQETLTRTNLDDIKQLGYQVMEAPKEAQEI